MFDISKINNDSYVADFIYKTKEFDLTFFSEEDKQKVRIVYQKCQFINTALECQLITQPPFVPPVVETVVEPVIEPVVITAPVVEEVQAIEPIIEVPAPVSKRSKK